MAEDRRNRSDSSSARPRENGSSQRRPRESGQARRQPQRGERYSDSRSSYERSSYERGQRQRTSRQPSAANRPSGDYRSAQRRSQVDDYRVSSGRYARSGASSQRASRSSAPARRSASTNPIAGLGRGPRFIILAVAIIVLLVIVGFAVSQCAGSGGSPEASSQAAPSAAASNASAASDAAAGSGSATSGAAPAASATQASSSSAPVQAAVVNAKPGDVSYPVVEAVKLRQRDADFAVNPNRRDWNYDKPNGRKVIYLTIDDGPSANTERVLDILDQYGCKATFFVTGQNPDYFPWIKEAYKRGHTIGLHSMTHDFALCYSSPEGFWEEFDAIGQVVKDQIGYVPCFIRFPGGASNTISADYSQGIMTFLAQDVQERGYQYYDWEMSCGDGAVHSAAELIEGGCQPPESDNVIYLAHDGSGKETTAEALPSIIEYYQGLGYSFEAIDRNTLLYQHDVSN